MTPNGQARARGRENEMNLDEELAQLLAGLNVVLEDAASTRPARDAEPRIHAQAEEMIDDDAIMDEDACTSELCLFQTSREHYGVFYRLDLVEGAPQLRVFLPDEASPVKMRCYLVRAGATSPLREWFAPAREHDGSEAYEDARDTAQQHLLFAAGELMKRLFWAGEPDELRFPAEIAVRRLV
jgi:hypothetical protein